MCGIIGYVGQRACKPLLLQGLAWGEGDVAQYRHVGEEVEGLVDDAEAAPNAVRVDAWGGYLLSFHHDAA